MSYRTKHITAAVLVAAFLLGALGVGIAAINGPQRCSRGPESAITPSPRPGAHRR